MPLRIAPSVCSAVLQPYLTTLQAGRQLVLRTAAKMAQKAEYIWMDGAEGQDSKASPLTLGWNMYTLLLPMLCY